MATYDLDGVIAVLNHHHQRATYSAVAALLDHAPRTLMQGRPRTQESSWVVSKGSGKPTGYPDADIHPELTSNDRVLSSREELEAWLESVEQPAVAAT